MASTLKKSIALLLGAIFVMMVMGPLASVVTWAFGWVVVLLFIPAIVLMAIWFSRNRAKEFGKGLLEEKGLTAEEWLEPTDPDDFEGEID